MMYRELFIQFGKNLILIGAVAGAYFLLGLLGLLFRIAPDPVSILMPSAGLALAATLIFGVRIVPGVAIGSFCVSAWAFDFNPGLLVFYVANAIGAALSGYIGASLIHRTVGFPNPLEKGKRIILFMLLGGPVSCLVSATIGVTALYGLELITLTDIPVAWLSWWMGDILGVLIVTPLTLILFAEPQQIWYRRRKTVGLPIVLTFALVILLFVYLMGVDRQQTAEHLKEKSITLSQALKNRIQLDLYSLHALRNFLLGSQSIDPLAFSRLSKQTLLPFKEMQSISWINIAENGTESRQIITSLNEQTYNTSENWQDIPPDLRKKMLENPALSKTEFLDLGKNDFRLVIPVVKELNQENKFLGAIITTVSMDGLIHQAFEALNTGNCALTISASSNGVSDAKIIYSDIADSNHEAYQTIPIPVADQTWLLSFHHNWDREKTGMRWPITWVMCSGLWFNGILGIVLLHLTGRYFRTEAIIDERTKKLTQTKIDAETANQAKSQFLAKISHELRTPLNGISGFTQLLEKKPSLNAEDKKQVAIIKQCSDNLLRLINDILDISAIESQQLKTELSDFNFALLLSDCIQICKFRADEKNLKLIVKNGCSTRHFLGDDKRIRQILVNLIDNAIKYTDKGSVTVTASYLDGNLIISVADTGYGIAKKDFGRIFLPFVQINADNFSHEGIGLGLSIIKELVNLMNGELTVSSQPGVGSVFSVSLPLSSTEKNESEAPTYSLGIDTKLDQAYVLVVDDSEINLLFLESMLEQIGCKVDSAMNGQEALALIGQNKYDFALIDINMPVMNGLELVKELRSQHIELKAAAVSAYADNDKIKEAFCAGFDTYLTKPIEEHQLVELIQTSLREPHPYLS